MIKKVIVTIFLLATPFINLASSNSNEQNKTFKFIEVSDETFNDEKYVIYTALWCPHCRSEYEHIQKIYDKYPNNFNLVVYVSSDNKKQDIENYFKAKKYTFPIVYDYDNYYRDYVYNIEFLPTTLKYKKGYAPEKIDNLVFNVNNYYEYNKFLIDKKVRENIKNISIINSENEEKKLLDVISSNSILFYADSGDEYDLNELERLEKIKNNRELIYLVNSENMTLEEYLEISKYSEYKKMYYVEGKKIKENFKLNDVSAVLEVKKSLFTNSFMPINIYRVK